MGMVLFTCRYREVSEMGAAAALEGTLKNVLRQQDIASVVSASTYINAPDRFNAWCDGALLVGETTADRRSWLLAWKNMDLSGLPGFPVWEEQVTAFSLGQCVHASCQHTCSCRCTCQRAAASIIQSILSGLLNSARVVRGAAGQFLVLLQVVDAWHTGRSQDDGCLGMD